mmetsp:Transcript_550/g.1613  ORF Transcript_550/g.1613 Transcript_550/m.1613 type:complete len:266 (+) Transcript_550:368-1165(+)
MLSEAGLVAVILLCAALAASIVGIVLYMCRKHRSKSIQLDSTVFRRLVSASNDTASVGGDSLRGAPWRGGQSPEDGNWAPAAAASRTSSVRSVVSQTSQTSQMSQMSTQSLQQFVEELGTRSVETHATLIIPNGLRLLKTCKALIHRLTATVIDFTSSASGRGLVVGSREEIVACATKMSESVDALTKSMYPPIDDADILTNATELVNAAEELTLVSKFNCKQDKLDWLDKVTKDVLHDFKVLVDSVQKYRNLHKNAAENFISDA